MGTKTFATRMTCFSLVSAIETDLRSVIGNMHSCNAFEIPEDVRDNAAFRYKSHHNEEYKDDELLENLLEFSDFSDLAKIISKNKSKQSSFSKEETSEIINGLNRLIQARNRVCHSRPLEYNDINELTDFCTRLLEIGSKHLWANINEALHNLDNPSFALSLQIPPYWNNSKNSVDNNLPLPEFDDTGFLGRIEERNAIKELIYSHTRVISLVGEGGIGKTALALRCLYDVLEHCENKNESPFDIIIWVTLKANRLTPSGVVQLRDAIINSIGLYQNIGKSLGISLDNNIDEILNEISLYMQEFKILLCIDNLETIEKESVRRFLAEIPSGSKVLITTRVGLGEVEYRYKLDSLDSKSSIDLVRKLSKLLNIESLKRKNNASLKDLVRRLHHNPLLIKWYALSISSGQTHGDILNRDSVSYKEALKFCFQNLYERLSDTELEIIRTITCLRNSVSAVELRFFLSDRNEIEIAEALHNLNNSSMLKSEVTANNKNDDIKTYTLTNIANEYLTSVNKIDEEFFSKVRRKSRELKNHIQEGMIDYNHYHLDVAHIHASNKDEKICAVYLKQALKAYRVYEDIDTALELVKRAKQMMPEFSECYRINGYLLNDSPFKAETEYESAIEYDPQSVVAYYSYSQFLMKDEEYTLALEQIDNAISVEPDSNALLSFKALILTRMGDYPEAIANYEKILPEQSENLHRKFRISTFQQIIDCYKRYAERLIIDKDFTAAGVKLSRALEIFATAFNTQNFDDRMLTLYCKLVCEIDKVDYHNQNINLGCEAIETLGPFINTLSVYHKIKLSNELKISSERVNTNNRDKWLDIANQLDDSSEDLANFMNGRIKELSCKKQNSVSFGFITGDNGTEYFFHRGEISPPDALDGIGEFRGKRVVFIPRIEPRGPSAKKVQLE